MRILEDYEIRKQDEDAKIANFRHLTTRAAHLALTNRALATAILSLGSNVQRYADICSFLDNSALGRMESGATTKLCEPKDENQAKEPEEWEGDPSTTCSGRTAQGKPCTKRVSYSMAGAPYCRTHYPFPPECYDADEARRNEWNKYFEERSRLLDRYVELESDIRSLEAMNELPQAAMARLGLAANRLEVPETTAPRSVVRVDGLTFTLEDASGVGSALAWWLRDKDGHRGALIQELSEGDWRAIPIDPFTAGFRDVHYVGSREDALRFAHLYQTFYRMRRKRDLSWYRDAVHQIIDSEIEITTPEPMRVLCGIEDPGSGWRVFRYDRRNGWVRVHNEASEAAARWEYERIKDPVPTAAILIDPAHQIIDYIGGSKELW